MKSLPIDRHLKEIVQSVEASGAAVLIAPPGAGKTTRVPQALTQAIPGRIILLQPRRIAARNSAERIAMEMNTPLGEGVGYQVRFEKKWRPSTRVLCLTSGMFLRFLQDDPLLTDTSTVIFDEFHERHLDSDLALALVRESRDLREDLNIIVMSATLEGQSVAQYLGGCPLIHVEGRSFPITVHYASRRESGSLCDRVVRQALECLQKESGDILVFLPGVSDIRRCEERLASACPSNVECHRLHGDLPLREQARVMAPSSKRKIILATNVAETSITIDGVGVVIDSGHAKRLRHDPRTGLDRLEERFISQASADQRAGRAGRTGPGTVHRLWTLAEHRSLEPFEGPEVSRLDLSRTVLEIKAWGIDDPMHFGWFQNPPDTHLEAAIAFLSSIGALDHEQGRITDLGRRLLRWPIHPRHGRLLIEAESRGCFDDAAIVAAICSERDIIPRAMSASLPGESDILMRLDAFRKIDAGGSVNLTLDRRAVAGVKRVAEQLKQYSHDKIANRLRDDVALGKCLLAAYSDRVTRRRQSGSPEALMVGGRGVRLAPESIVKDAEYFLSIEVEGGSRRSHDQGIVRLASAIELEWIREVFEDRCRMEDVIVFDPEKERVVGSRREWFDDLILWEKIIGTPASNAGIAEVLCEAIRAFPLRAIPDSDDLTSWIDRVRFLSHHSPQLGFPVYDRDYLIEQLITLTPGCRSFAEVRQAPLLPLLRSQLTRHQNKTLDSDAPEYVTLPMGRRARLIYAEGEIPVLRARVQDLFGLHQSPKLAEGKVTCLVELLAPNQRTVQRTQDLASFWKTTYAQVRKDLRGRYPKHAWPETPP